MPLYVFLIDQGGLNIYCLHFSQLLYPDVTQKTIDGSFVNLITLFLCLIGLISVLCQGGLDIFTTRTSF